MPNEGDDPFSRTLAEYSRFASKYLAPTFMEKEDKLRKLQQELCDHFNCLELFSLIKHLAGL